MANGFGSSLTAGRDTEENARLSRLRGLLTPQQFGRQQEQASLSGSLGTELNNINRSGLRDLVGSTSALGARGLGGGISAGNLASVARSRQSALNDFQGVLNDNRRIFEDEERNRQNTFGALVSSINTSDLKDPQQAQLLKQQLQQAIQAGALTPSEQATLDSLLSGRTTRFDGPKALGIAGLQVDPNELGQGSFIQELGQGLAGKDSQGLGGFLGDTVSLGIPKAFRSVGDIASGQGNAEDFLNIALTALTPFIGGGASKLASGLGGRLAGRAGGKLIGGGLGKIGTQAGRNFATKSLFGSGLRSAITPRLV
jgi:hypothetical protein